MKKTKQFIYSYTPEIDGVITGILEGSRKSLIEKDLRNKIRTEYKGKKRYYAMTSLQVEAIA